MIVRRRRLAHLERDAVGMIVKRDGVGRKSGIDARRKLISTSILRYTIVRHGQVQGEYVHGFDD